MSDTTTPVTDAPVDETPTDSAPADSPDTSEVEKWKALARKNEQRAKENAEKAKRFDEFEEANKSELQKLQDRLTAAESAAAAAESARLRASIAARHGVPEALLTGSTEEALEQAAAELLAFKGTPPSAPSSDGQGKQGQPVTSGLKQLTDADLESMTPDQINAARKSGQLDQLMGRK